MVGAGAAGLATAYELALARRDVVVVEQFDLGHDRGSSHGASRVFRLSYPDPRWVRLAQEALRGWRRYEDDLGERLLRTTGSLDVGSHVPANRLALEACRASTEAVSPTDAAERWGLVLDDGEPALFQPEAGVLAAARALALLASAACAAGARVVPRTTVRAIEVDADAVHLHGPTGTVRASAVVVTAGAWVAPLLEPLGIDVPVTVTRETVAYLDVPHTDDLPVLVFAESARADREGQIVTYALADGPATLKVGVHHTGPCADPDDPGEPDPVVVRTASSWAARRLPTRPARHDRSQACLYTSTSDEHFVLERHGRVVVGSACSGHGFKFTPVIGATLARLAGEAVGEPA